MTLLSPPQRMTPRLDDLVTAIRAVVSGHTDWHRTTQLAAGALRRHLPSAELVTADDPVQHRSRLLHAEPDGAFSILAVVWRPGQVTRIHDRGRWPAERRANGKRCLGRHDVAGRLYHRAERRG
jgi:predicted metal-dependent enzyme (double-stranded beta helix superfamily)